jgi:hypothetical protein
MGGLPGHFSVRKIFSAGWLWRLAADRLSSGAHARPVRIDTLSSNRSLKIQSPRGPGTTSSSAGPSLRRLLSSYQRAEQVVILRFRPHGLPSGRRDLVVGDSAGSWQSFYDAPRDRRPNVDQRAGVSWCSGRVVPQGRRASRPRRCRPVPRGLVSCRVGHQQGRRRVPGGRLPRSNPRQRGRHGRQPDADGQPGVTASTTVRGDLARRWRRDLFHQVDGLEGSVSVLSLGHGAVPNCRLQGAQAATTRPTARTRRRSGAAGRNQRQLHDPVRRIETLWLS